MLIMLNKKCNPLQAILEFKFQCKQVYKIIYLFENMVI